MIWSTAVNQLIKFCLVGIVNTALDFSVYFSLTRWWLWWERHYLLANVVAFILANLFSFALNKFWTFKNRRPVDYYWQYLKFLLVSVGALAIVELTLYWFVALGQLPDWWGKIVGTIFAIVWSFSWHRWWTFK